MPRVPSHTKIPSIPWEMKAAAAPSSGHPRRRRAWERAWEEQLRSKRASPIFISIGSGGFQLLSQSRPRLPTIVSANASYGPSLLLPSHLSDRNQISASVLIRWFLINWCKIYSQNCTLSQFADVELSIKDSIFGPLFCFSHQLWARLLSCGPQNEVSISQNNNKNTSGKLKYL